MSRALRIAFMGTPDFALSALQALIASPHDVVCVYSQPPRPKGRGQKVQPSIVQAVAENHHIDVRTPLNFKHQDDVKVFQDLNLDVAVVAAYGLILPQVILDAPQYGCINIHASSLPRWRGAAPIHRAIWAGDPETGVTLMQMDAGLDTGNIIDIQKTPITDQTTLSDLHDKLASIGAQMIVSVLDKLAETGVLNSTPQPEAGMTYAKMLTKQDGHIDWSQSAADIDRQIRALNPWPGTWCLTQEGQRLKILEAEVTQDSTDRSAGIILKKGKIACNKGTVLMLKTVQPENKKPIDIKTALNGGHIKVSDKLS